MQITKIRPYSPIHARQVCVRCVGGASAQNFVSALFRGSCNGRIEVPVRIHQCIWPFISFPKKVQRTMQFTKFRLELWSHLERVTITSWTSAPDSCASRWNISTLSAIAAIGGDWDTRQPRERIPSVDFTRFLHAVEHSAIYSKQNLTNNLWTSFEMASTLAEHQLSGLSDNFLSDFRTHSAAFYCCEKSSSPFVLPFFRYTLQLHLVVNWVTDVFWVAHSRSPLQYTNTLKSFLSSVEKHRVKRKPFWKPTRGKKQK